MTPADGDEQDDPIRIAADALVVLVGPSGSGKSTWAETNLGASHVVSSDGLRAVVGVGPHDQRAGTDAFDVLDLIVERRLKRGLLTVVDTLGFDTDRRRRWIAAAQRHGRPRHAVVFHTDQRTCRARNKARPTPVPSKALTQQFRRHAEVTAELADDGFDAVHDERSAVVVAPPFLDTATSRRRQETDPVKLRFGLQIPRFDFSDDSGETAAHLARVVRDAERVGVSSIWVMDHFQQIPQVGRAWEPMLDSYTTLGFLAAHTSTARIGTLVTGITYRNIAHLGKIVATLDVLSAGRAVCGIGAAWFEQEHRDYGWDFPPVAERYDLLEDALELLPMLWGPGQPSFEGRAIHVPKAICYPRPIQERVPILVGGSGERRTLRVVAQHADACNLFGEADVVRHKVEVLRRHCTEVGRDPSDITVTQLGSILVGIDGADLEARLTAMTPTNATSHEVARRVNGATVDDHIGRFRDLVDAGVHEAIVSLPDVAAPDALDRLAPVIAAFS